MARYAVYVNVSRCIGCYACIVGCNNWHNEEVGRIRIIDKTEGIYPDIVRWIFPLMCMHCDEPSCVQACPEEAIYKRDDGIVWIDDYKCIGCGECIEVCPYEAIVMDEAEGKAKKCDLCMDRVDRGMNPFCVEVCPTDALVFGDLDNAEDKISMLSKEALILLSEKVKGGSVFYQAFKELDNIVAKEV